MKKILAIENDPNLKALIERALRSAIELEEVELIFPLSYKIAKEKIKKERFDLILVNLKVESEEYEIIKTVAQEKKATRILILASKKTPEEQLLKALNVGRVNNIVSFPFTVDLLEKEIEKTLSQSTLYRVQNIRPRLTGGMAKSEIMTKIEDFDEDSCLNIAKEVCGYLPSKYLDILEDELLNIQ